MDTTNQQPPAAAAEKQANKKKKDRVIVVEPCPPAVATGYLVLRAALDAVVGVPLVDTTPGVLQSLWMKHPNTAKFAVSVGKKGGSGQLNLQDVSEAEVLDAIEAAANRLLTEGHDIGAVSLSKQDIVDQFSTACLDPSHKKTKADQTLTLAAVGPSDNLLALAVTPSLPYHNTLALERIEILAKSKISKVQTSPKKAEITLQFVVVEKDKDSLPPITELSPSSVLANWSIDALQQRRVRAPEGRVLLEAMQQKDPPPGPDAETSAAAAGVANMDLRDQATASGQEDEMVVNIETVTGKIDYNRLVEKFGSTLISQDLLKRFEAQTVGKGRVPVLHRFLRRNLFFSHRDLDLLLEQVEKGVPMYLYTGRGPSSSSMHLGHLIPFMFTQWLQQAFDVPLVIQMTDDEKFIFKGEYDDATGDNLDHFMDMTMENARDIIACGFDYDKTFLFSDVDYVGSMYPNVVRIWKAVTTNAVNGIFGFTGSDNIGKVAFPAIQAAPSFASSFPTVLEAGRDSNMVCLIPCAIDQDPYFRMTRDVAHKLVDKKHGLSGKPALIHSKFFCPLQGATGKMSSSEENSAIFLTDTSDDIEKKIKHAFSGGQTTKKLQEELGADLETDVAYQWLRFFLEDDEELDRIGRDYSSGSGEYWSPVKVKGRLIGILQELVATHQERRAKITDDEVRKWMKERSIV